MQDSTRTPAKSITRRCTVSDKIDGATVQTRVHVVTVSREVKGGPMSAVIDGKPADVTRAYWIIKDAWKVEELSREDFAAPIGKPRAHKLHKIMARLGLAHAQHYAFAARALGQEVASLAALTENEARRVWAALVSAYPAARQAAA